MDSDRRFWRRKTYFSDEKSTSVADFEDAKLIIAMQNRRRWPILTMPYKF